MFPWDDGGASTKGTPRCRGGLHTVRLGGSLVPRSCDGVHQSMSLGYRPAGDPALEYQWHRWLQTAADCLVVGNSARTPGLSARNSAVGYRSGGVLAGPGQGRWGLFYVASGHTSSKTPGLIRTRKLSGERPGQYWGGGPPGKPFGCCWLLCAATHHRPISTKWPG